MEISRAQSPTNVMSIVVMALISIKHKPHQAKIGIKPPFISKFGFRRVSQQSDFFFIFFITFSFASINFEYKMAEGQGALESSRVVQDGEVPGTSKAAAAAANNAEVTDGKVDMVGFCCEDIDIPPVLTCVLKIYAKAALKTQPRDLLKWSAAYFRALANGEVLPVKDRMENPVKETPSGLSAGVLRLLHQQFRDKKNCDVTLDQVRQKWNEIGLEPQSFEALAQLNNLENDFCWPRFVAVAAGSIGESLSDTMRIICVVLTDQPEGKDPAINFETWWNNYTFLAAPVASQEQMKKVYEFLYPISNENGGGLIGPADFLKQECPELSSAPANGGAPAPANDGASAPAPQ